MTGPSRVRSRPAARLLAGPVTEHRSERDAGGHRAHGSGLRHQHHVDGTRDECRCVSS